MKILPLNSIDKTQALSKKDNLKQKNNSLQGFDFNKTQGHMTGVPLSYISFKSDKVSKEFILTPEAEKLLEEAKKVASEYSHKEIMPQHIIEASIRETEQNLAILNQGELDTNITSISTLNLIANNAAKKSMLSNVEDFKYFMDSVQTLREQNQEALKNIPAGEEQNNSEDLSLSKDLVKTLNNFPAEVGSVNPSILLGVAFNLITYKQIAYTGNFIKSFNTLSHFRDIDELEYMPSYNARAIDAWNKLALGSNLNITYQNEAEAERLITSLIETVNEPKHGNYNTNNTMIYVMANDINQNTILEEVNSVAEIEPEMKKIFVTDFNSLLTVNKEGNAELPNELIDYANSNNENIKFIFLHQNESYNNLMEVPRANKIFTNFVQYSIPPMRTFETQELLNKDKSYLEDVKTPFSKQARNKAILYADKIDGAFPDKAIDFMNRIADYYGENKKRISEKDVDEFAYIAKDIFNKEEEGTKVIYDTGKNLNSLYGKETIKKDLEAIVKQIKTGRAGTKGYLLYAQDEEAGSGKRFTAQALAGEAQVPYIEISSSDFAYDVYEDSSSRVDPKALLTRIFNDAKIAAEQNKDKTAIIYIDSFEDLAFEGFYNVGYKQAKSQIEKEIAKAQAEDVNIIVIGGINQYYKDAVPLFVRDFNQVLSIDSPAFDNRSRSEIITNRLAAKNIPLAVKNRQEKEDLINKLVKITAYMSFVDIKTFIDKAQSIMIERGKTRASLGEFIEAYLQVQTGRTSMPEMPEYNRRATTSHECGHALSLEVMNEILKEKGEPWHQAENVNFITLDPRGNFLGAVFEGRQENMHYPFEAMFAGIVCAYGGYAAEKLFFNMNGSAGISQDLAQASSAAKYGVEYYGFGHNTGKISGASGIKSGEYHENVFKDMNVILKNAQLASELIGETYKGFNQWFTDKYSKLIGTNNCMVDGDTFRKSLAIWKAKQSPSAKEEFAILSDMVMDIIETSKKGIIYGKVKAIK